MRAAQVLSLAKSLRLVPEVSKGEHFKELRGPDYWPAFLGKTLYGAGRVHTRCRCSLHSTLFWRLVSQPPVLRSSFVDCPICRVEFLVASAVTLVSQALLHGMGDMMPWGTLRERPPKRGGVWRPRLRLIQQPLFEVISKARILRPLLCLSLRPTHQPHPWG